MTQNSAPDGPTLKHSLEVVYHLLHSIDCDLLSQAYARKTCICEQLAWKDNGPNKAL